MSSRLAKINSLVDGLGIFTCVGNHVNVSHICSHLVSHTHTLYHLYDWSAGLRYHPSTACGVHEVRCWGFSCISTLVPDGASGVVL